MRATQEIDRPKLEATAREKWIAAGVIAVLALVVLALAQLGRGGVDEQFTPAPPAATPTREGPSLQDQVEAAFRDSYGDPADWLIERFSDDNGHRNVTVVSRLADKPENAADAMGTCRAVASVSGISAEWNRVIVTAGERGPFIAECERP